MPITVVGAMDGDRPTWTLAGHLGIIGHDSVLVRLAAPHFINDAPLTLECSVEDIYETPNFESFICTIVNTYVADDGTPVVSMTTDISSDGLMAIYKARGASPSESIAVKLSTGEPGSNFVLGIKRFLLYLLFVMVFSFITGIIVNIIV